MTRQFLLDLADGAHNFLLNWPRRYPPIKTQDFFMPLCTTTCGVGFVYDQRKDIQIYVNHLKGFMVGNPEADYYYDCSALPRYAWTCYVRDQTSSTSKPNKCSLQRLHTNLPEP
ncbi:hypothetical protein SLEP1_g36594 [Rubroshorea leprosula]|uniref:Uncharacterized protein n=1 Tax=Rubroshorea leprosula TaxID=152421 RepID=A0AAV5KS76_9ROSI|nr:hypothetical protein SLEP1_g36594 [Rubroshorea leprosula]